MTYKTLLFDLDGTLSDPFLGFARSMNFALSSLGFPIVEDEQLKQYIGPPLEISLSELLGTKDKKLIEQAIGKYRERYIEIGFKENTLYQGIKEALEILQERGQSMAVCTSKALRPATMVLEFFDIAGYFEFVSGGDKVEGKWQQIETLLEQKKICRNSLMIGDRKFDIKAAHKNQLTAAGVLWGYGSEQELGVENPRYMIVSPEEILECV